MTGFVRQFVSYSQYQICSAAEGEWLEIYTVGDDLLHVGGPAGCTGFTGVHTGDIEIQIRAYGSEPPLDDDDAWDAAAETTLWCPAGRLTVIGLLGGHRDGLTGVPVPGDGLIRLRAYARNRIHESVREDDDPPEQHELHVWPVTEETGRLSLWTDGSRGDWRQEPGKAAEWAMRRLLEQCRDREQRRDDAPGARVTVVRSRTLPAAVARVLPECLAGVIPAGDLEIRLRPADSPPTGAEPAALTWEWATAAQPISPYPVTTLPDEATSPVRFLVGPGDGGAEVTVRHEGVPCRQAVLLGLIWDHLLDGVTGPRRPAPEAWAWEVTLRARAAEATRLAERRRRLEEDAGAWGGAG
ncbi:hypothetical protein QLQ12_29100 [Actinoplanes sp. NEAU-A12]|uniref:Uncharacterized protein n=1 Tax=Actinoplanes sandaracinus TaxID=3045177 RepID=A0ABT6WSH7_9ACTN|nr:hypothetical protein [Actinoplanes sandaracinus]MDI6102684.1 hypothetical protein [Actinoplanes sandaracinus]